MIRSVLPLLGLVALVVSSCGSSTPSTGVTAGLGAKSLPAINPPAYIPGPLNGESTKRALALRRPLAIILENFAPDSRPQSGLASASTVIETLAEGGVTRFLALYLEKDAAKVGPVRSTRLYFDHWASAFHAILGHVGGNDDAQALLWHLPKVFNIDENRWEKSLYDTGTPLFFRTSDRVAPHNLYTNTYSLRNYAVKNGQNWSYTNASFPHSAPTPLAQRGHTNRISLTFLNPLYPQDDPAYDVQYRFDRNTDTYFRSMGGAPHIDANTGKQLSPSNVVILRTGNSTPDPAAGPTPQSILIPTVGTGAAWYFRDGKVTRGTWQQANENAPLRLLDHRGHEEALDPGQTWIEVMPPSSSATWAGR